MATPPDSLELLLEASLLLSSKLELGELLETIIELSKRVADAERASLLLLDPTTDELYFDIALGLDPDLAKLRLPKGKGIAGACVAEGKSLVINDARNDPRWSPAMDTSSGFVTRSILASPMKALGRTIGVVEAINHRGAGFSEDGVRVFEAFAAQAAVAVENARLFSTLREEKSRLATIFTRMTDGALLVDGSGFVLLANGAAVRNLGTRCSAGARLEGAFGALAVKPELPALLASAAADVEFEAARDLPKALILQGTASLVRYEQPGAHGQTSTGRLIVFRDVTAQRQEEVLKRNFLSLISHKLKTPLASITGYSELVLDEPPASLPPALSGALRTIHAQGLKLASLVDKLLNYTVLEELKEADMAREAVPVDALVADATESLEEWLQEKGGTVEPKPAPGLAVWGDKTLLREVLKNLIENGVKFADGRKAVEVWAEPAEGGVTLCVRDRGPGIPPEVQEKIFDKFYQVEPSFTGQVEGWGLGLAFVKKVVETHGGRVTLESALGSGTLVRLWFPAPLRQAQAPGTAA